jgi:heme-degrading monooxygenase HmoA|tara:strand:+ start:128 stop:457 length:330 start_codon:yes stop_codon:yes gene_type:complete
MYLAMSRLKIVCGKEAKFEEAWKKRQQNVDGVKGFKEFNLIKGHTNKEFTLYIFHSEWNSEIDFINWTKSGSFQDAHKKPTLESNLYLGPPDFDGYMELPDFEGFKVVI